LAGEAESVGTPAPAVFTLMNPPRELPQPRLGLTAVRALTAFRLALVPACRAAFRFGSST
jgi:hypothetical protein